MEQQPVQLHMEQFTFKLADFEGPLDLLLYLVSNSFAVETHAGATGRSLSVILKENPGFFPKFLLKSLAGMVIGGEELLRWIQEGLISDPVSASRMLRLKMYTSVSQVCRHTRPTPRPHMLI